MSKILDLTGQKFGRLKVLQFIEIRKHHSYWLCKCNCGNITEVSNSSLRSGKVKSCGCLRKETAKENVIKSQTTHHLTNTRIYNIWRSMKKRCYLKSYKAYKDYGGRGIRVCDEWRNDFMSFYNWAVANGYKENLTLDRIDVNGNYEPNNCRWVDWKTQQNNRRDNIHIQYNGENKSVYEWANTFDIKYCTLWWRIKNGWSIEDALTMKVRKCK